MSSFVIATAGHVDHGKSTLVRALTGIEPDRWAEERKRGLTIDLGFAWTALPSGRQVAFVDVPGHERYVGNMLAGLGPVPVVCFVIAADEGWQAQSSEHRDAIAALGITAGLIVITRRDRAPDAVPEVTARARAELRGTGLAAAPIVACSGVTGEGLDEVRGALDGVLAGLPEPDPHTRLRLWVDRAFTIAGSGTVVTGTPDRSSLRAVQTPQGFRLPLLRRAYEEHFGRPADEALHATDDASLVERLGEPVHVVQGDPMAFKVTTPLDLALATQIAEEAESTEFEISGE